MTSINKYRLFWGWTRGLTAAALLLMTACFFGGLAMTSFLAILVSMLSILWVGVVLFLTSG